MFRRKESRAYQLKYACGLVLRFDGLALGNAGSIGSALLGLPEFITGEISGLPSLPLDGLPQSLSLPLSLPSRIFAELLRLLSGLGCGALDVLNLVGRHLDC